MTANPKPLLGAPPLLRIGAALGVAASGYLHAELYIHGYRAIPGIGPAFLLQASASFAVALLLLASGALILRLGALAVTLGALGGFVLSRTVGVLGFIEHGLEPAPQALLSIGVEVVTVALLAIGLRHRTPGPRPAQTAASSDTAGAVHPLHRIGLLRDLEHPGQMLTALGPNWYATVMGTGIVAVAAATMPRQIPGLHTAALVVWLLASTLLIAVSAAWAGQWLRYRRAARDVARNPVMAQFYGVPPIALLVAGAGTLLLGKDILGQSLALHIDAVLWTLGTLGGLAAAVSIPYLMFTRLELDTDSTFGGWLLPVVPPMVSAGTGALLIPHLHGQAQLTMLLGCYAMFGLSLLASVIITTLIWNRLAMHNLGPAAMEPTMWIVLGWVGQSITAVNLLGGVAHLSLPPLYSDAFEALGLVYGVPALGFALLWIALATAATIRTARQRLPFTMSWWAFTFPLGTVVTGTSALAAHTGSTVLAWLAVALYLALITAWAVVAARTAHGSARGQLFQPPTPTPSPAPTPSPTSDPVPVPA